MLTYFMNANVLYILAVFEKVEINTSVISMHGNKWGPAFKKKKSLVEGDE